MKKKAKAPGAPKPGASTSSEKPKAPPVAPPENPFPDLGKRKIWRDEYGLTVRQRRFVREYLIDLNAKRACLRAGYCAKNPKNADSIGPRLVSKSRVKAEISRLQRLREKRMQIDADKVIAKLKSMGLTNIKDLVEWDGDRVNLKDSQSLSRRHTAAVRKVTQTVTEAGGTVTIELHDALGPLKLLGQHIGLFGKDSEDGGSSSKERDTSANLKDRAAVLAEKYAKESEGEESGGVE